MLNTVRYPHFTCTVIKTSILFTKDKSMPGISLFPPSLLSTFLSTYYVPDNVLGFEDAKSRKCLYLWSS